MKLVFKLSWLFLAQAREELLEFPRFFFPAQAPLCFHALVILERGVGGLILTQQPASSLPSQAK